MSTSINARARSNQIVVYRRDFCVDVDYTDLAVMELPDARNLVSQLGLAIGVAEKAQAKLDVVEQERLLVRRKEIEQELVRINQRLADSGARVTRQPPQEEQK